MGLLELVSLVLNAQSCLDGGLCPGSSFHAITAAFATQGYFAQADLLYYLNFTGLSQIAGLIYILAGAGGIVAFALGAPPKNYLWFFIGPAVYYWLVDNPVNMQGTRWMTANQNPTQEEQNEVWRLAEPGLKNSHYIIANQIQVSKNSAPTGGNTGGTAQVAVFFVWVDELVSDLVQNFVHMTGVYDLQGGQGGSDSNIDAQVGPSNRNWSVLSDLKWTKVEDITAAKLRNGDTRDAFVTFLASECGDAFSSTIDESAWTAAVTGDVKNIPPTVFKIGSNYQGNEDLVGAYALTSALRGEAIPIPDSLRNLITKGLKESPKSFSNSASFLKEKVSQYFAQNSEGGIPCDGYLWIVLHAFRYEAGHIYFQLFDNPPGEFRNDPNEDAVVFNLLYGWGINGNADDRRRFLQDLILVHLLRNEFAIAPQPIDPRYSASRESKNYVDSFARLVGQKTKYAEVYSWALMIPYFQGLALYYLAIAYPFAALMVIIPGWHKTIFTWVTFWAWIKLWDLGFALVKVAERSIWAMIGNGSNMQHLIDQVKKMSALGYVDVQCNGSNCIIPDVTYSTGTEGMTDMVATFQIFGRALSLAASLDLDLANSYYIYIMAALYFAVPAITGQIILGAKAGASGIVNGFVSGFGEKVSAGAQSGFTGDMSQRVKSNVGSLGQAAYGKEMRRSGLGLEALNDTNRGADAGLLNSELGTRNTLSANQASAARYKTESATSANVAARSGIDAGDKVADALLSKAKPSGEAAGAAAGDAAGNSAAASTGNKNPANNGKAKKITPTAPAAATLNKGTKIAASGAQTASAIAHDNATQDNIGYQVGALAGQSDRSLGQFAAQAEQTRAQNHGGRLGEFAEYNAGMRAWEAKRNFGNQIAASATIGGMHAGGVEPGAKPEKGSAMSGILNTYSAPERQSGSSSGVSAFGLGSAIKRQDGVGAANYFASERHGNFAAGNNTGGAGVSMRAQDGTYSKSANASFDAMRPHAGKAVEDTFGVNVSIGESIAALPNEAANGVSPGARPNRDSSKGSSVHSSSWSPQDNTGRISGKK